MLSGLIEQYLAHSKANNSEGVYVRDCHTLNDFGAFIGDHLLTDITPRHIERWKDWRSQQKGRRESYLSPTTINRDLNTIRAMFNLAVMWRMMEESPLRFVKNKKTQQALPKPYSEEEIHKILAASPEPWRTIWLIFLNTGMRRGEVQRMLWNHIREGQIHVPLAKGGRERVIPISPELNEVLSSIERTAERVIPFNERWLSRMFKRCATSAGIGGNLHRLRHSFATHLLAQGVDIKVVSRLLGHASVRTTEIYAEVIDRLKTEAVARLHFNKSVPNVPKAHALTSN